MNQTEQTLAIIHQVFSAFDNHDLDAFRQLLAEDAALNVGGNDQTFQGAEAIVTTVGRTLDILPDLRVTVTNAFAHGPDGVAEVVREGTNTKPIPLPDVTEAPATGQRVRLPECAVFKIQAGKIVRMVVYTDLLDTYQQLGLLP